MKGLSIAVRMPSLLSLSNSLADGVATSRASLSRSAIRLAPTMGMMPCAVVTSSVTKTFARQASWMKQQLLDRASPASGGTIELARAF